MNNMPQSETPRTDACPKSIGFLTVEMAKLEHELNEALHVKDLAIKENLIHDAQIEQLQKELDKAKRMFHIEEIAKTQFAKQNHKMKGVFLKVLKQLPKVGAWDNHCPLCYAKVPHGELVHHQDCSILEIDACLKEPDISSLIVLSRAEVETWPCKCFDRSGNNSNDIGVIKCTKHILLERFTK